MTTGACHPHLGRARFWTNCGIFISRVSILRSVPFCKEPWTNISGSHFLNDTLSIIFTVDIYPVYIMKNLSELSVAGVAWMIQHLVVLAQKWIMIQILEIRSGCFRIVVYWSFLIIWFCSRAEVMICHTWNIFKVFSSSQSFLPRNNLWKWQAN